MAVAEAGTGGRWMSKSMRTAIRATLTARLSCWQSSPWELSYDEQIRGGEPQFALIAIIGLASFVALSLRCSCSSTTLPIKLIAVKLLLAQNVLKIPCHHFAVVLQNLDKRKLITRNLAKIIW
jgi:hypothetical protein